MAIARLAQDLSNSTCGNRFIKKFTNILYFIKGFQLISKSMYYLSVSERISGHPEREELVSIVEVLYLSTIMFIIE